MTDAQARQWAMFAHLSALAGGFISAGFLPFVGPLIIWLVKKDENPFVADQAREALNFNITATIGFWVSYMLMFVFIGFLTFAVIGIAWLILTIMAAMAANNGQQYRYPLSLRLVN